MADILKLRRGTTAQHATFTGSASEITVDTDKHAVVVHDGITPGGFPLISRFLANVLGTVARWLPEKLADTVSVKDFGAIGDGLTNDDIAINAAVTHCVASGAHLVWPHGQYLSAANIPNLHTVQHRGPGAIKRGSTLFYVCPKNGQTNSVFVSTTGSTGNDGITSGTPGTIQGAFNALKNYGPVLRGTWEVRLAAGTYHNSTSLVGLRSENRILVIGPSVGGHPNVPTAVIDGTGVTSDVGMYFQNYIHVQVQDIKFQHWTFGGTNSFGLIADGHCDLVTENVHATDCYYAGISADNLTQIRTKGGVIDSCTFFGIRCYSQVSASIGYSGTSVGDSTIITNCNIGIYGAVSSRIHVDYPKLLANDVGLFVEKNTRAVANFTKFENNTVAVRYDQNSIYGESGATNTFVGNTKDYISYGSEDDISAFQRFWDRTSQRTLYGATAWRTVNAKYEWQLDSAASGSSYNSNVKAIFDFNGAGTNWLGMSCPVTGSVGLLATSVAKPAQGALYYNFNGDAWQLWVNNNTRAFQWNSTRFSSDSDNAVTLGNASFRWSTVYAGTGTINTSDAREKQQVRTVSEAEAAVAHTLKTMLRAFKFNDAVAQKGDNARVHFGVLAQDVRDVFLANGLNPDNYAMLCHDTWPEQSEVVVDGNVVTPYRPAGDRYGIRYDELLVFLMTAI